MVPGGCRSQGCHGYLRGLLAAPLCFIRHLPHTHLHVLLMGLNWICMREPTCAEGHHLVDIWQHTVPLRSLSILPLVLQGTVKPAKEASMASRL